jgi:hypothetical protein
MNERIKQLYEQSQTDEGWYDTEKFTELLLLDVMELQCLSERERKEICLAYGIDYKPKMMKHPLYGALFAEDEWNEAVDAGYFNSDDGSGYWATKTEYAYFSCWNQRPEWATHVLWFNK